MAVKVIILVYCKKMFILGYQLMGKVNNAKY